MAYPHGLFSWTDISLPDPAAGSRFYAGLFGWDAEDQHDPDGNHIYTMFSKDGKAVAGLGPQPPEMASSGIPPMWNSYIAVNSVDDTVAKWTEAGGSVVMPAMDVMDAGRMAVVADPAGGVVSLWQAGRHAGAEVFTGHGTMTWNELATRDSAAARDFYAKVLGWDFQKAEFPGEYWTIHMASKEKGQAYEPDDFNGGILTMDENWPAELPSHWMVYFNVDDIDAAVAKLEELGGKVSVPIFESPVGRMSVVGDSQGGTFTMIQPAPQPQS